MPSPLSEVPKKNTPHLADKIDRYGDLDLQVQLFAPIKEEHELLKKEIEASLADKPGDLPAVVDGRRYQIQLTARRNERTIVNKRKLFNRLKALIGLDGFLALITIPLGEGVDKNVPKSERSAFLVEERTGARTLSVVPQKPAAA
jgi:hypothetical protein